MKQDPRPERPLDWLAYGMLLFGPPLLYLLLRLVF
jgi:hypothetical protein